MNTLSYFLSTLRPAPSPSPRASTSELPIPLQLAQAAQERRASAVTQDDSDLEKQTDAAEALDTDRDSSRMDEQGRAGSRMDGGDEVVYLDERRREPPRIGVVPPSRRGSRKGKSRADEEDHGRIVQLEEDPVRDGATVQTEVERDEGVEVAPPSSLVVHDKPSSAGAISTADDRPSWPFVARLARLWPFRLTASLYVLIRRFLSLFGIPYAPRPNFNSILAPVSAALTTDPEKHARSNTTILSLSLRQARTPSVSPPPSPSPTPSPSGLTIPRPVRTPRLTPKTLVLDLDETLIHSTSRPSASMMGRGGRAAPKGLKATVVEVVLDGRSTVYTVYKRPWVDFFLRKVSSWYTVIIFTASLPEYADPVIDWLDGGDGRGGLIGGRLFRAQCLARNGSYVKDLSVVEKDLARVCLVDNSPVSYAINQANGIPIEGWINDPHDECLLDLLPMLDSLRFTNDVRRVLGLKGFGRTAIGEARPRK
ncbi:hypothetical protein JCM5296_002388 [Sporobolomyces johnsonii]